MPTLNVRVDILLRLVGAASTEEMRYYFNGVHVRTRARTPGVVLEATDGHKLAIELDDEGTADGPAIVHTVAIYDITRIVKSMEKQRHDRTTMRVEITNNGFRVYSPSKDVNTLAESVAHTFTNGLAFIDGTFPDVERVIPRPPEDGEAAFAGMFNPAQMLALAQTAKTLDKRNSAHPCVLFQRDARGAALVRVAGAPNWLGVIMPVPSVAVGGPLPAWFA